MSLEELQEPEEEEEPKNHDLRNLLILLGLIALPPLVLIIGSLVSRSFYDNVAFEYYWEPISKDAAGLSAEYNAVNTTTYGFMAVLGAVATYIIFKNWFKKTNTRIDLWFYLSVLPLIIGGAVFRTLEDAWVFKTPFRYFFITPIIYVVIWFIAVLLAIFTFKIILVYKNRREGACKVRDSPIANLLGKVPGTVYLVLPLIAMDLFYAWAYWFQADWYLVLPHPILVFVVSILFMSALFYIQRNGGKKL